MEGCVRHRGAGTAGVSLICVWSLCGASPIREYITNTIYCNSFVHPTRHRSINPRVPQQQSLSLLSQPLSMTQIAPRGFFLWLGSLRVAYVIPTATGGRSDSIA